MQLGSEVATGIGGRSITLRVYHNVLKQHHPLTWKTLWNVIPVLLFWGTHFLFVNTKAVPPLPDIILNYIQVDLRKMYIVNQLRHTATIKVCDKRTVMKAWRWCCWCKRGLSDIRCWAQCSRFVGPWRRSCPILTQSESYSENWNRTKANHICPNLGPRWNLSVRMNEKYHHVWRRFWTGSSNDQGCQVFPFLSKALEGGTSQKTSQVSS